MMRSPVSISMLALLALLAALPPRASADIELYESRFRIDDLLSPALPDVTFCCNLGAAPALPGAWNVAGFDFSTGLGTIIATVTGAGTHTIVLGLNHDLMPASDPDYTNDRAEAIGTAGTTLWEIDEPGYADPPIGNLFANVAGDLDNHNDTPGPEDIAMALGHTFNLAAGETGTITFRLDTTAPASGFYLRQYERDVDSVYFSASSPVITGGGGTPAVPEPGTWLLLATTLALLAFNRKLRLANR